MIIRHGKNEITKYVIKLKNKKTRSIKTKRPLVEYKTVTNINLLLTGNRFLPVFTETALEVERNNIK